jgi:putative Ig domain-containing protein/uncharacterized protein DUF5977
LKPDQYPSWIPWQRWTYESKQETCHNNDCALPNWQPEYRAGYDLKLAPEESVTDGDRFWTARTGFTFQVRIAWKGVARLTKMLLASESQDVPKFEALQMAPPDDPLTAIVARVVPAFTYYNEAQTYSCPAGTTGTPVTVAAGTFTSTVSLAAANAAAYASAQSMAVCTIYKPVITNGAETTLAGQTFTYSIIASNSPTSYGATGLPTGLSINTSTGVISGTPTAAGRFTVAISATNAGGTGNGTLTLTVTESLSFTFSKLEEEGTHTYEVSVDGGAYAAINFANTYTPTTQLKLRTTITPGTYNVGGIAVLAIASIAAAGGTSIPSTITLNSTGAFTGTLSLVQNAETTFPLATGINQDVSAPSFSLTKNISSNIAAQGSAQLHVFGLATGGSITVSSQVNETIINFS